MDPLVIRRTVLGAVVGGGLSGVIAFIQVLRSGVSPGQVVQPLLALVILGATVGALAGPLVGAARARWRGREEPPSRNRPPAD